VPAGQAEQTLGEKPPTTEENVPAGQATQEDSEKYDPAGQGMHGDAVELASASAAPRVLVWAQPELSTPYGAYMKLGVHRGVLAMYSLA
jgi:hypothetical protein